MSVITINRCDLTGLPIGYTVKEKGKPDVEKFSHSYSKDGKLQFDKIKRGWAVI